MLSEPAAQLYFGRRMRLCRLSPSPFSQPVSTAVLKGSAAHGHARPGLCSCSGEGREGASLLLSLSSRKSPTLTALIPRLCVPPQALRSAALACRLMLLMGVPRLSSGTRRGGAMLAW